MGESDLGACVIQEGNVDPKSSKQSKKRTERQQANRCRKASQCSRRAAKDIPLQNFATMK